MNIKLLERRVGELQRETKRLNEQIGTLLYDTETGGVTQLQKDTVMFKLEHCKDCIKDIEKELK